MGDRTQHEGKTERAKESHDRCSQPPGMRMPKTTDLGTQALLVVNSFKLHLNAYNRPMTDNIVLAEIINDLHFIDRSGLTKGKCNLRERRIKIR